MANCPKIGASQLSCRAAFPYSRSGMMCRTFIFGPDEAPAAQQHKGDSDTHRCNPGRSRPRTHSEYRSRKNRVSAALLVGLAFAGGPPREAKRGSTRVDAGPGNPKFFQYREYRPEEEYPVPERREIIPAARGAGRVRSRRRGNS